VVIANAGISKDYDSVATVSLEAVKEHVEVNEYGPLLLFQAVLPLLNASPYPKFVALGTPISSISGMESRPFPMAAYGMSKVMLHWLVRKMHFEHPNLTAFVLDPGFVQTDMGNEGARKFGIGKATTTIEDSTNYLVSVLRILLESRVTWLLTLLRLTRPPRKRLRVTSQQLRVGTLSGSYMSSKALQST
jgi:norsolorinic acid ketoreductase